MFEERLNTSEVTPGEAKHKAVQEGLCESSVTGQTSSSVNESFNFELLQLLPL